MHRLRLLLACCWLVAAMAGPGNGWAEPAALLQATSAPTSARAARPFRAGFDDLALELGHFPGSAEQIDHQVFGLARYGLVWDPGGSWSARLGARLQLYYEYGDRRISDVDLRADESYLRYSRPERRITIGTQHIAWGRMDIESPMDQFTPQDLTRGLASAYDHQRLSVPALRWEEYLGERKIDLVWLAVFTPTRLPEQQSLWYPINRRNGQVLGTDKDPQLRTLLRFSTIGEYDGSRESGGGAIRYSQTGSALDWSVSLQRVRTPRPYFEIDPRLQRLLPNRVNLFEILRARTRRETFRAVHPWTTIIGGDLGGSMENATWRLEAAWSSDIAMTTRDFRQVTTAQWHWAAAWEYFPELADLRVQVQLNARHHQRRDVLEPRHQLQLLGDIDWYWDRQRWRGSLRYLAGVMVREWYLNPELAYLGTTTGEWYLAGHWFSGGDQSLAGFYSDNDFVAIGWRRRLR